MCLWKPERTFGAWCTGIWAASSCFTFPCFHRTAILERCLRRLEFDKARDAEAKAQADQLEAERMAMQSIDWYAAFTITVFPLCSCQLFPTAQLYARAC